MNAKDFELLTSVLKKRSGLQLSQDKIYLLESRLTPLARRRGMNSLDELLALLHRGAPEDLLQEITEAMTTNESFFFRDQTPFDIFQKEVLPGLRERRASRKKLRIWCAAASSGQEPYSLAMILKEQGAQWDGWSIEIIGTDISQEVLRKAEAGLYSQFEVQRGLPIQLLIKYFEQTGEMWQLDQSIRNMVQFREYNLLDSLTMLGQFDVIFCRNVLIYFDQPTKSDVLERMSGIMPQDGSLFLGAAETVLGISDRFKPVRGQRGLYVLSAGEGQAQQQAASA